jgi:hypothetical protein
LTFGFSRLAVPLVRDRATGRAVGAWRATGTTATCGSVNSGQLDKAARSVGAGRCDRSANTEPTPLPLEFNAGFNQIIECSFLKL